MKIRKERKEKPKAETIEKKSDVQAKEKKPGKIFNPCVRFLQWMICIAGVYYLVFHTAITVVPMIGSTLASVTPSEAAEDIVALIVYWLMPYLFCTVFLFVGEFFLIKKVGSVICKYADDLIEKYRVAQTKMIEDYKSVTESSEE